MDKIEENIVKIFISYSWKPISNKDKVISLAERLSNDGIHVVVDDWDLKEGQDKYHFMEQMVNDPNVSKVLLICNKEYAEKANNKKGGVGIESLIISDDIYNQALQTKFIPIVMEYDSSGNPFVPTFVKTRIFIDLSNDNDFEENYEKLIRNIYNKPLSKRPPIGKMPIHLLDNNPIFLLTANKVSTLKNSLINNKPNSKLLIKDYLDTFIDALLSFKINHTTLNNNNFIDEVEKGIDDLQVLKNDFIDFITTICKFSTEGFGDDIFDFFEKLLQRFEDNEIQLVSGKSLDSLSQDNFKFFLYDLFLSLITLLIKNEKFEEVSMLIKNNFIISRKYDKTDIINFVRFRTYNYTLNEFKNQSINPKRISVVADKIKQYATILNFKDLKETDILLYYLSLDYPSKHFFKYWFPETSCYNSFDINVLPKIVSKRFFEKVKILFDVNSANELREKIDNLEKIDNEFQSHSDRFHYTIPSIKNGLHYENIAEN